MFKLVCNLEYNIKFMCQTKPLNTSKPHRKCVVCDSTLFGRSDKIFCSSKCKNVYHSELRKTNKTVSSETIKVLYRNYRILCEVMGENCFKYEINKLVLQSKGFDFDTITGFETNKFGFKLKVFDFSWYFSYNSKVVIYFNPTQDNISPFLYKRWERFGLAEI